MLDLESFRILRYGNKNIGVQFFEKESSPEIFFATGTRFGKFRWELGRSIRVGF